MDPEWIRIQIGIQLKMLNPDHGSATLVGSQAYGRWGGGEGAGVERNHATTRKLGPPEIVQSSLGTVRVFLGHTPFTCSLSSERRDLNVLCQ